MFFIVFISFPGPLKSLFLQFVVSGNRQRSQSECLIEGLFKDTLLQLLFEPSWLHFLPSSID